MRPRGFAPPLALLAAISLVSQPAAAAPAPAPCGPDKKATLVLVDANTTNKTAFKPSFRPKATQDLDLVFRVKGCRLLSAEPAPKMIPRPIKDQEKLPQEALESVTADPGDGTTLSLTIEIARNDVDPGSYGGALEAQAPYLARNSTPVTVSRTDDMRFPAGVGAVAGLLALVWFGLAKVFGRGQLQIRRGWLLVLPVLAAAVGAWQGFSAYWDQEVWVLDQNWKGTGTAAFSAATAGALGALLATVWKTPDEDETEEETEEEPRAREAPVQPPRA